MTFMLQSVSVKDTRDNLAEMVGRVALSGEKFVITKFGKPTAMLVPVISTEADFSDNFDEVFGAWSKRGDVIDASSWVKKIRGELNFRRSGG